MDVSPGDAAPLALSAAGRYALPLAHVVKLKRQLLIVPLRAGTTTVEEGEARTMRLARFGGLMDDLAGMTCRA